MNSHSRSWARLCCVGAVLIVSAGIALAHGDDSASQKALDKQIHASLRSVINQGADLFNLQKDVAGCYHVYQGSLLTLRPLLSHHPELQKTIDEGLSSSDRMARMVDRAFALRKVIDHIRVKLDPEGKKIDDTKIAKTLWDRLGGESNVTKVIDDFVAMAAKDPKVDFTRGGKFKVDEAGVNRLKKLLLEMVSQETGGPYKYTGKNMKEVHASMGITDAEFNAVAGHLKHALEMHKADPADIDLVLKAVGATRKDIVEPKKIDPKKLENGETAKVSGKVVFKGQALDSGFITLVNTDSGRKFSASIHKDGTFILKKGMPAGDYHVYYQQSVIPVLDKNGQLIKEVPAPGPKVALKYRSAETSGLRSTLKSGDNQIQLELQ
jgi:hemoglobin